MTADNQHIGEDIECVMNALARKRGWKRPRRGQIWRSAGSIFRTAMHGDIV
jgi:hypothetical protein